jgi:diaminohydroxyphosphoribosylaminopyrimidine deaminase / 5-amino-6-(5-phosphoribosylamino)uracil reductase
MSVAVLSVTDQAQDERFIALAATLGRRGLGRTWPNPAVGAVVVRRDGADPIVVGRGWTQAGGRPHAETEALGRAGRAARGATLYVSLEPCSHHGKTPPCADAIIAAGVARVVSALEDPNPKVAGLGHARLRAAGIALAVGVGAAEARRVHAGHIRRMRDGRPHITLKLAVSADEKAGLAGRRPAAITGEAARDRVHLLRAENDAVLIGIGTALADDPLLTCRLPGMTARSPVRIVLDSRLRLPPEGRLARSAREIPVWVIAAAAAPVAAERRLADQGVKILRMEGGAAVDLDAAVKLLAARGITRLLAEAGPILAAALIEADLVDEAVLFRSQAALGADGIDALEGQSLGALVRSPRLRATRVEPAGPDSVEFFERA